MSWTVKKGINLRQTVAYVSDPTATVCLPGLGGGSTDLPAYSSSSLSLGGDTFTVGWVVTATGADVGGAEDGARNESASVDARLAGWQVNRTDTTPESLKCQFGTAAGSYKIWLGVCHQGGATTSATSIVIRDSNGTLATVTGTGTIPQGSVCDATGTTLTNAAWTGTPDTTGTHITVTTTDTSNGNGGPFIYFDCGSDSTFNNPLAHVSVQFVSTGTAYSLAVAEGAFGLTGEAGQSDFAIPSQEGAFALTGYTTNELGIHASNEGAFTLTGFAVGFAYAIYAPPVLPVLIYGKNIPTGAPAKRTIDMRSLAYGAAGPEMFYPVYQFSDGYRARWEQPGHNPFLHIPPYY